ncbi:hypothetical protein [Allosphingosinicella indica]|uniref:Uncharacterized protein n=1 Tax=Allosphingosinicella indica TaxID=941907 RepID=A0A1X7FYC1_9SPHN|nr:hypothetical protein [Allosphingosinicella indica]SMF61004.1 hypothetical protein SAMN06295910_0094 [Allosphingosinicella indica]
MKIMYRPAPSRALGSVSRATKGSGGMMPEASGLWYRAGVTAD